MATETPTRRPTAAVIDQRHQPHRGRWAVGLVALMALGTGATWAVVSPRNEASPHSEAPTASQPTAPSPTGGRTGQQDVRWLALGGLLLPVSQTDGPRCQTDGLATCFSRTPRGAAFAATNLLARTFPFAGSKVFGPTIRNQVTGRHARALMRLTWQAYRQTAQVAGIRDGAPIPSEGGWIAGYRIADGTSDTSPDQMAVRILIRQDAEGGEVGFVEYSVSLVWRDNDWQLVAPAWGDWRSSARALPTTDPRSYRGFDQVGGQG